MLAPIILFTYNRPKHTQQTVECLQRNKQAKDSDLFIFSDGAKDKSVEESVQATRLYLKNIVGFHSVQIVEREKNFGLANNIIDGISQIIYQYEKAIIVEDDLLTSPYFLQYMNEALTLYEKEDNVVSVHGYVYPIKQKLPETFFLRGADCWGWATWKRGWDVFNPNAKELLQKIKDDKLGKIFDFNGTYPYVKMLEQQIQGKVDSWAIRWYASAFLKNKFTLYPGKSLVDYNGNDGTGTHCGIEENFKTSLSERPIVLQKIEIKENKQMYNAFAHYLFYTSFNLRVKSFFKKLLINYN
jgi:HEPN domain-containing protein